MNNINRFIQEPEALQIPWIDSPFFDHQLEASGATPELKDMARRFHDQGFLVLEGLFDPKLIDGVLSDFDAMFSPETQFNADPEIDAWFKRDPTRRQDAWIISKAARQLACHPRVLEILKFLYRRRPIPFQTLNFHTGTEQSMHSDAIHFDSIPNGYMCGVWVALEDMTEENGALLYSPGSHRLPVVSLDQFGLWSDSPTDDLGAEYELYEDWVRALIQGCNLEVMKLTVPKGTALIWASNLLHGGSPITREGATRYSQVTHYYFENCVYYTPVHSNPMSGELRLKSVYDIENLVDVPHTINGMSLDLVPDARRHHRVGRAGTLAGLAPTDAARQQALEKVIAALQHQANAVLADRKLKSSDRAQAMARLCEVSLKAMQLADSNGSD